MIFHNATQPEVLRELHTDAAAGLTEAQVQQIRSQYGENKLREKKKKTNLLMNWKMG